MTESNVRLAVKNGTINRVYGDLVNRKIRRRYSLSEELSVMRQKDDKPEEFAEFNAYVEECKREAKSYLGLGGNDESTDV